MIASTTFDQTGAYRCTTRDALRTLGGNVHKTLKIVLLLHENDEVSLCVCLDPWFSNIDKLQYHQEGLLKHRFLGSHHDAVCLWFCFSFQKKRTLGMIVLPNLIR